MRLKTPPNEGRTKALRFMGRKCKLLIVSFGLSAIEVSMTRADIVQTIYNRVGAFSKREAADVVEIVFETMKETLERGEAIKVSGFGNFLLRDKQPRMGRNPKTGETMQIPTRRVLTFKPSVMLRESVNRGKAS